jgi:hypothetical protein
MLGVGCEGALHAYGFPILFAVQFQFLAVRPAELQLRPPRLPQHCLVDWELLDRPRLAHPPAQEASDEGVGEGASQTVVAESVSAGEEHAGNCVRCVVVGGAAVGAGQPLHYSNSNDCGHFWRVQARLPRLLD